MGQAEGGPSWQTRAVEWRIEVPSAGRAATLAAKTLPLLRSAGVPDRDVRVWVPAAERDAYAAAALPEAALRYVDLPVAGRRKTRSELAARTVGRTVDALRIATARDFDCHDLFRDQARFMFYNPPKALAGLPQVVLR